MKKINSLFLGLVILGLTACSTSTPIPPTPTPSALVLQGKKVFTARCATCHALVPDTIIIGPSLYGIATVAETRVEGQSAEEYMLLSVLRPGDYIVEGFNNVMITNLAKELTNEDMNALVAFMMTLK